MSAPWLPCASVGCLVVFASFGEAAAAASSAASTAALQASSTTQSDVDALPPDRAGELDRWVREYTKYQEWRAQWLTRAEPGWFSARKRREKPDPPAWLDEACREATYNDPSEWQPFAPTPWSTAMSAVRHAGRVEIDPLYQISPVFNLDSVLQ